MTQERDIIWSALPIAAFILDMDDCVARLNPAAEAFLHRSIRSSQGLPFADLLRIDGLPETGLDRVRLNQSPMVFNELSVTAKGRATSTCHVEIAPLSEAEGTVMVLISPREIAGKLDRAQSASTAAKSAIGMAEMLAHEIKNPLAGITGAAQLLSMNLSPADMELTDLIVAESHRIVKLLEQVEQFGNLQPPQRKPVNLHDLLDRARKSAELSFASDLRFVNDYDPSLPLTLADGDQMLQVFSNLLRNAAEAIERAGQGGKIAIRTFYDLSLRKRVKGGESLPVPLQVEVVDDGPGLPPEIAGDVFEPFVSGRENGTGLGLALVSKIVSENDGLIAVESEPGRTVFRISLPMARTTTSTKQTLKTEDS